MDFSPLDPQDALTLDAIEVLCKAAAVDSKVMALHDEHKEGVKLIEGVKNAEEVARISMRC